MLSSKNLYNKRVYVDGSKKSFGRIRAFLFIEKNCIGFIIKRPDFLWMFHRKPAFIALSDCAVKKDGIFAKKTKAIVKENKIDEQAIS